VRQGKKTKALILILNMNRQFTALSLLNINKKRNCQKASQSVITVMWWPSLRPVCIVRTQDMFAWRWRTTIPDHGHGRNAQFPPPLNSSSIFFYICVAEWVTDNCALSNEKGRRKGGKGWVREWERERERYMERIFALDRFLGCLESVSWCFWKDWICNKIEHCDVGMVFHSTLESRCHLETKKTCDHHYS